MSSNDDFRVRPGRIRSTSGPRTKLFFAGAPGRAERPAVFHAALAVVAEGSVEDGRRASPCHAPGARPIRLGQGSRRSPHAFARRATSPHRVSQARSVTRDGSPGKLVDAARDDAEGRAFDEPCEGDRHHFRFIVSPDGAGELSRLRSFTKEASLQGPDAKTATGPSHRFKATAENR